MLTSWFSSNSDSSAASTCRGSATALVSSVLSQTTKPYKVQIQVMNCLVALPNQVQKQAYKAEGRRMGVDPPIIHVPAGHSPTRS